MKPRKPIALALASIIALVALAFAGEARAQALDVSVWTDKGNDAVYQPGDQMQVRVKVNGDAYLLVYEIDSDGFVHVLYPTRGQDGHAPGGETMNFPDPSEDRELVVENNTGQDYIVAIASRQAFGDLPWYLREHNDQGDAMGYVNQPQADEEGVTTDGRIVGDPFVAMERIRRRVIAQSGDEASFATAYTTYYVHEQVQYPRYICNDCHRPGHWAWWDGWDPYYSTCSAVSFRVNWAWAWGPSYWFGAVPYYVYAYRPGCPPQWHGPGAWTSSWDGWTRWTQNWNGGLVRVKSAPPMGYRSPVAYPNWHGGAVPAPPGMLVTGHNRMVSPQGGANGPVAGIHATRLGGPQALHMPATRSGDPVYVHPNRQAERGAWNPWRIQDNTQRGAGGMPAPARADR